MAKTKIEWCDYTINPVKGLCPVACDYCYARAMYKNPYYKTMYQNQEIRFDWSVANDLGKMKPGSRVFWGSTMELFGDWVKPEWMSLIMEVVKRHSDLTHIFLTKRPENLPREFPDNCRVGISIDGTPKTSFLDFDRVRAKVKFVSFEPLLAPATQYLHLLRNLGINWVIIGAQSPHSEKTAPKWEWVKEIIEAADKAGIPVFLKNNLGLPKFSCEGGTPFYKKHPSGTMKLRQELPLD